VDALLIPPPERKYSTKRSLLPRAGSLPPVHDERIDCFVRVARRRSGAPFSPLGRFGMERSAIVGVLSFLGRE